MPLSVLYAGNPEFWPDYECALATAFADAGLNADLHQDLSNPAAVDYIIYAPNGSLSDFTPFTRTKAVLSLWAGVERIVSNKTLTQPLTRMVDSGLAEGMVEWVVGHVLRHHLGMDRHVLGQNGIWDPITPPLARNRVVGILGLGALGQASAAALNALNFQVKGWSRTAKSLPGMRCHHGKNGLKDTLQSADIVVLLLPDTPATENTLNTETIALMKPGAVVINPGRGTLIDDEALLTALDRGTISHATLDTFRIEPLPAAHPYWVHPQVTVTPHIAAETRPKTSAQLIAENIRRNEAGEDMLHLVDRTAGY